MEKLREKVAVVTGAASGIGLALSEAFLAEGMSVVMADVEAPALDDAAARLAATGTVLPVVVDVSNEASMVALRDAALAHFGRVNLLCNNAGVGGGGPLQTVSLATWRWTIGVNLWGVIYGVQTFLDHLLSHGDGHIVNTGSIAGIMSFPNMGPYNVSKHAVVTLTETLYQELLQAGSTVGATVLCPGFVNTNIVRSERNRPEALAEPLVEPDPEREQLRAVAVELYTQTKPPAAVAALVVEAIKAKRLYCFTDDQFAPAIAQRHRDLEAAANPASVGQLLEHLLRSG